MVQSQSKSVTKKLRQSHIGQQGFLTKDRSFCTNGIRWAFDTFAKKATDANLTITPAA